MLSLKVWNPPDVLFFRQSARHSWNLLRGAVDGTAPCILVKHLRLFISLLLRDNRKKSLFVFVKQLLISLGMTCSIEKFEIDIITSAKYLVYGHTLYNHRISVTSLETRIVNRSLLTLYPAISVSLLEARICWEGPSIFSFIVSIENIYQHSNILIF